MAYFDESQSDRPIKGINLQQQNNGPYFCLLDEQKNNINKRMPRGFCLVKRIDYQREKQKNRRWLNNQEIIIDYKPKKKEHDIDLNNPFVSTIEQNWANRATSDPRKIKAVVQSVEGRNRQIQKIKNIIQRFRKHPKYPPLASFLNRIGMMQGLNQIQSQNKKGLLTIDTFKQRFMLVLETAKNTTFEDKVKQLIDEIVQDLICYAEQARKVQFENNIQSIQKSIDKITRYASESNWYIRKRKKGDKADNNYSEKQILYIGSLIHKLPTPYLIGVLEIIQEKPVIQCEEEEQTVIKLFQLTNRKLKDVQVYVKGKLCLLNRSRERKAQKIAKKFNKNNSEADKSVDEEQNDQKSIQVANQNKDDVQPNQEIKEDEEYENKSGSEYDYIKQMGKSVSVMKDEQLLKNSPNFVDQFFDDNELYDPSRKQEADRNQEKNQQPKGQVNDKNIQQRGKGQKNQKNKKKQHQNQEKIEQDDSMDQNQSSDSSMITDEDQSDF